MRSPISAVLETAIKVGLIQRELLKSVNDFHNLWQTYGKLCKSDFWNHVSCPPPMKPVSKYQGSVLKHLKRYSIRVFEMTITAISFKLSWLKISARSAERNL